MYYSLLVIISVLRQKGLRIPSNAQRGDHFPNEEVEFTPVHFTHPAKNAVRLSEVVMVENESLGSTGWGKI